MRNGLWVSKARRSGAHLKGRCRHLPSVSVALAVAAVVAVEAVGSALPAAQATVGWVKVAAAAAGEAEGEAEATA